MFHLAWDSRSGHVLAAVNHGIWGPHVEHSNDLGATWAAAKQKPNFFAEDDPILSRMWRPTGDTSRQSPRFAADGDDTLKRVWHLEPGRASEPGTIYAGVEPAALFKSTNDGHTWQEISSLSQHSSRLLKNPDLANNGRTLRYEHWDDFGPSTPFSAPC